MVCDTLDRFHIVGKRDLYPSQLSGGQQQLVAVARAVIANPKLILADEPTGNLHSSQGKEIMELFKKLNDEGTTIVQVTHSEENAAYGNRVIQLADGWVVSGGSEAKAAQGGFRRFGPWPRSCCDFVVLPGATMAPSVMQVLQAGQHKLIYLELQPEMVPRSRARRASRPGQGLAAHHPTGFEHPRTASAAAAVRCGRSGESGLVFALPVLCGRAHRVGDADAP